MKIKSNTKAFTLVELMVVITILAVLAAIAFISIGNVTADARNSKRQNDLSSISTAVRNIVEIKGMPISNAVSDVGSGVVTLSGGYIAGRNISDTKLEYKAGDVNYDQLQIKSSEFEDPNGIPYIIGATKLSGQVFELAASLELPGNKKSAYVLGTYVPRLGSTSSNSVSGIIDSDHFNITLQNDINVGMLKIGDIITTQIGIENGEIINISSDGRTITYDPVAQSSTTWTSSGVGVFAGSSDSSDIKSIYLGSMVSGVFTGSTEPAGLIKGSSGGPVTNDSQTNLPYGGSNSDSGGSPLALVSGSCTGLPTNSAYFLGVTSYSLVDAPNGTNLTASYNVTPTTNTCQYNCTGGYSGNDCATPPTPAWTVGGGGDCTAVDNTLGSNGNTSTCLDDRTYTMQGGATHDKTYSLIKIAGKWWFNENLAYPLTDPDKYKGSGVWSITDVGYYSCPGINTTTNVDCSLVSSLGYLYQWSAAMAGGASNNNQGARTQGICPSSWGLPTKSDFTSASNAYWPTDDEAWNGNTAGWIRTYAGGRNNAVSGSFYDRASSEYVWSSFEDSTFPTSAWQVWFHPGIPTQSHRKIKGKPDGNSVRCLKN